MVAEVVSQSGTSAHNGRVGARKLIWGDVDPYENFPSDLYQPDLQGWGSDHHYLIEAVLHFRPQIIVEIGVWKGGSSIAMAQTLKDNSVDGCVISIDTWLGAWDHWCDPEWFESLAMQNGQPQLMKIFMRNVIHKDVCEYIVPLPLDSVNAYEVVHRKGIAPDILHIDAGHDYRAVFTDLEMWWPTLRPGGLLIGDDYTPNGVWQGVERAFNDFFTPLGLFPIENADNKCRIVKPPT